MEPLYTKEEKSKVYALSQVGLTVTYAFCENCILGGKSVPLGDSAEVKATRKAGVNYLPVGFFSFALGCEILGAGEEMAVTLGDKSFSVYKNKEEMLPIVKGGVVYIPAMLCARALGIGAKEFCNGKMIAFGGKELLDELSANENLTVAASFLIFGEYPTSFTKEEFAYGRQKWRERTVGTPETNDLSDPVVVDKIRQIDEACERQMGRINLQPDATVLFGEMRIPIESDELSHLYVPLWAMAKAYGTYGSKYYKDPEVCKLIKYGMQWGYEHMYGEAEFTNTGWRDVNACNWWHWMVGAPDPMTDILITMEDEFSFEEKETYLKLFVWFLTWRCNTDASAMTRVVICTKCALILEKPEMLYQSFLDYNRSINVGMGSSVRIDYTDWSHFMPYNVGYGQLKLDRSLYVASNLAGTAMQFRSPRSYNIFDMLQYTYGPAVYRCQAYVMHHGRNNHIAESAAGSKICVDTLNMLGLFGEEEDEAIRAFVKRNAATPALESRMRGWCSLTNCRTLNSILAMPEQPPLRYAYAWYTGDRFTQHRHGAAVGIAMNSSRSKSYESILNMNLMGWYTTDGTTYYYTPYDDGQYDGANFMFNSRVAHRLPGTTEDIREREPRSVYDNPWYSTTPYAGSISVRDEFGVAAMEYVSEHFEGPEHGNLSGYGGTRGIFDNDLFAKKAWFAFDDELLCLGSDIKSTMNSDIITSIEHRRIMLDEERDIILSVGGERRVLPKEDYLITETGVDYVYIDGHGGFVLDNSATVYIHRYKSEECKGQWFIEFGYSHGKNPKGAKYIYSAVLTKDEEFVKSYAKNPSYKLLKQTENALCAACPKLGIAGYVFYAPDECNGISVDQRMILVTSEENGVTELRVSDVTQLLTAATVTVSVGNAQILDKSDAITARVEGGKLVVEVDFEGSFGRPYFIRYKS